MIYTNIKLVKRIQKSYIIQIAYVKLNKFNKQNLYIRNSSPKQQNIIKLHTFYSIEDTYRERQREIHIEREKGERYIHIYRESASERRWLLYLTSLIFGNHAPNRTAMAREKQWQEREMIINKWRQLRFILVCNKLFNI